MRIITLLATVALALAGCSQSDGRPAAPTIQFQRVADDQIAHGERISAVLGCSGCHGADLTGEDWSDPEFGALWIANLTRAIPRYTDAQLATVITTGRRPDRELWGMPSHLFTHLTADDMSALIAFLRSKPQTGEVHPEPLFSDRTRQEIAAGTFSSSATEVARDGKTMPPDAGPEHAYAQYIVRATCAECHGLDLRGGVPNPGMQARPDLRIAAAYELEAFRVMLRTGVPPGGRDLGLMAEVARGRYSHLTDAEIDAIHAYLKAVAEQHP